MASGAAMLKRELISHNRVRCGAGARVGELAEDVGRNVAIVPACHSRLALDAGEFVWAGMCRW